MARKWTNFDLDIVPREIEVLVRQIKNATAELSEFLRILIEILRTGRLLLLALVDPLIAAITALLALLDDLLADLVVGVGIHVLVLPVIPNRGTAKDVEFLRYEPLQLIKSGDQPLLSINPPSLQGQGGNWGFYQTVITSLYDVKDSQRPDYPDNFYTAGVVLVTGAPRLGKLLEEVFRLLRLLKKLTPDPPTKFVFPVPQDLTVVSYTPRNTEIPDFSGKTLLDMAAQITLAPETTEPFAVQLRWNLPKTLDIVAELFEGIVINVTKVFVYKKEGAPFEETETGDRLAQYVVYETDNIFQTTLYLNDIPQETEFFFAAGYELTFIEDDEDGNSVVTVLSHYDTSNVVRVYVDDVGDMQSIAKGPLPNWSALRSPLSVFPPVERAIRNLQQLLLTLRDNILGDKLKEFDEWVQFLEDTVEFYKVRVDQGVAALDALQAFLEALSFNGYIYSFFGSGGVDFLATELNQAFNEDATQNKPPFDSGEDFVTGIVLVAASPNLDVVNSVKAILEFLFGVIPDVGARGRNGANDAFSQANITRGELTASEDRSVFSQIGMQLDQVESIVEELEQAAGIVGGNGVTEVEESAVHSTNDFIDCTEG